MPGPFICFLRTLCRTKQAFGCCAAFGRDGLPNLTALPLRERLAAAQRFVEASMAAGRGYPGGSTAAAHRAPPAAQSGSVGRSAGAPMQPPPGAAGYAGRQPPSVAYYVPQAAAQMLTTVPVLPSEAAAGRAPMRPAAPRPGVLSIPLLVYPQSMLARSLSCLLLRRLP